MNIGRSAPEFTALDRDGKSVQLQDFHGKWLVLYFYPKDLTPGCTTQAIDFTARLSQFQALNIHVVGISPDSIASHDKFIKKHSLEITLLSDPEHQIAEAYGVWQLKQFMGKEYMGIIRSTFLIDPSGKIVQLWSKVKVKNHADIVLESARSLSAIGR
jgi:thioredoxin-dependent peroxiredoxin